MMSASGAGRGDGGNGLTLPSGLLQNLPASVAYLAGPDLVFVFANHEYQQTVGGRELIGRPLREALPELPPERVAFVEGVLRTGQPRSGRETELWIRRGGEEPEQIFIDFVYQPVPDDAGGVAGVLLFGHDVTAHIRDRRDLESLADRLAVTQERYQTLFETLPLGVVHYNANGSVLGANPAAGAILGLGPEGMTTWPLNLSRQPVHEDGSPYEPDELPVRVALRTGQVVSDVVVGMLDKRTGDVQWLHITAVPDARDEHGRPHRAYAMFSDITEERRAQAALRESSRLLSRLRDANIVGVAVLTEQGVQEANDAYLDIIGYSRDDLEAGRIHFRAITPPEWSAVDDAAIEELRRTGVAQPWEKEYLHRDGHRVPILVGAAMIDAHPLRWASFVVDLTARQRREQERQALLARVQAARTEADTARERLEFLLRAGEVADATGNESDLLKQVSQLVDVAVTGSGGRVSSGRAEAEAGRAHAALQTINAELEKRVSRRTSELVHAEAARRALETELQQTERMQTVGQLTSSIAHDFANLLAVIVGYAEMAEDITEGEADPDLGRILAEIRGAADRAVRLSSDLLRFSHRARTKREEIDVDALVAAFTDLLTVSMGGRAEVRFERSATPLPAVLADRGQLEQVLLNLAINARDAMPDGGTLTISTSLAEFGPEGDRPHPGTRPGRYVEVTVRDTGTGMSPEVQARIFDRFFTTKPAGRGTGLGLSTVQGIVAGLGGAIEVSSEEGHGTTFRIYLRAIQASAPDPGPRPEAA